MALGGSSSVTYPYAKSPQQLEIGGVPLELVEAQGTLSKTLDACTLAAAGTVSSAGDINGTAAITLGACTLAATGTVEVQGQLSRTLAAATLAATGTVEVQGQLSRTLGAATLAATGTVEVQGQLSRTLGAATLAAAGTVASGSVNGTAAITLGTCTLAAAGTVSGVGVASKSGGGTKDKRDDGLLYTIAPPSQRELRVRPKRGQGRSVCTCRPGVLADRCQTAATSRGRSLGTVTGCREILSHFAHQHSQARTRIAPTMDRSLCPLGGIGWQRARRAPVLRAWALTQQQADDSDAVLAAMQ